VRQADSGRYTSTPAECMLKSPRQAVAPRPQMPRDPEMRKPLRKCRASERARRSSSRRATRGHNEVRHASLQSAASAKTNAFLVPHAQSCSPARMVRTLTKAVALKSGGFEMLETVLTVATLSPSSVPTCLLFPPLPGQLQRSSKWLRASVVSTKIIWTLARCARPAVGPAMAPLLSVFTRKQYGRRDD
jgi:hypothetical protein